MVTNGGLDEIRALYARNLPDDLPAMKALGVPNLIEFFEHKISRDGAIARAITQTRQYAKRQYTSVSYTHLDVYKRQIFKRYVIFFAKVLKAF